MQANQSFSRLKTVPSLYTHHIVLERPSYYGLRYSLQTVKTDMVKNLDMTADMTTTTFPSETYLETNKLGTVASFDLLVL